MTFKAGDLVYMTNEGKSHDGWISEAKIYINEKPFPWRIHHLLNDLLCFDDIRVKYTNECYRWNPKWFYTTPTLQKNNPCGEVPCREQKISKEDPYKKHETLHAQNVVQFQLNQNKCFICRKNGMYEDGRSATLYGDTIVIKNEKHMHGRCYEAAKGFYESQNSLIGISNEVKSIEDVFEFMRIFYEKKQSKEMKAVACKIMSSCDVTKNPWS